MDVQPAHGCAEQADRLLALEVEAQNFRDGGTRCPVLCHVATSLGLGHWIDDVALLSVTVLSCIDGCPLYVV